MKEARKNDYFVDGFFIKHFNIWPVGVEKNNLFYEQKVFVMNLMATIPDLSDWTTQIQYNRELYDIENLKSVRMEEADIDVAKLQEENIEKLKQKYPDWEEYKYWFEKPLKSKKQYDKETAELHETLRAIKLGKLP